MDGGVISSEDDDAMVMKNERRAKTCWRRAHDLSSTYVRHKTITTDDVLTFFSLRRHKIAATMTTMARGAAARLCRQWSGRVLAAQRQSCRLAPGVVSCRAGASWKEHAQVREIHHRGSRNSDTTSGETVVLANEEEEEVNTNANDETEEWQERLHEALQHHESITLEKDKTAWIASLERVRDAHVHLGQWK